MPSGRYDIGERKMLSFHLLCFGYHPCSHALYTNVQRPVETVTVRFLLLSNEHNRLVFGKVH